MYFSFWGVGVEVRFGVGFLASFAWFITFTNCEQNSQTQFVPWQETLVLLFLPSKAVSSSHALSILWKPKVSIWLQLFDVRKREPLNGSHAGLCLFLPLFISLLTLWGKDTGALDQNSKQLLDRWAVALEKWSERMSVRVLECKCEQLGLS